MPRYNFAPPRPDYPAASVAHLSSAAPSFLGTEALAGVALVFPVLMLVQMMSNDEGVGLLEKRVGMHPA
jgi:hypothetical protein